MQFIEIVFKVGLMDWMNQVELYTPRNNLGNPVDEEETWKTVQLCKLFRKVQMDTDLEAYII